MSLWIGVHGIGQQYGSREEVLKRWGPALIGGVEWATQRRIQPDLDVAYYGYLFRAVEPRRTGKGPVSSDAMTDLVDLDDEELADLIAAVDEIVTPNDLAEAAARREKAFLWLPAPVVTRIGALERRFPGASGALIMSTFGKFAVIYGIRS